jgi:5-methylthioadenosine/S-adenosylhomocysteine deaminase
MSKLPPQTEFWIKDAWVVTQDKSRRVFKGHVQVVDGRIARVSPSAPSRISRGARVVDGSGSALTPGLIQTHVHLCQTLFRNLADDLELLDWLSKRIWVFEAAHTARTLRASAELGIHELLASGTTCILDMGTVRHTGAIFEAVRDSGIRASVGKCLMDHPETTPKGLRESTRDALAEARALFSEWNGQEDDRIRVSYAPRFVVSCTEALLSEVARLSREQKALIHTHASENLKEIELVKKLVGCENVEYLHQLGITSPRLVLAHCIWLKPHEMRILQRSGTHVAHCPSSNLKLASGIARVPEMLEKGINVGLGADGAPCNNRLNAFDEMRLAALIQKPGNGPRSMPAQTVLDMATRNGAKALGWWDDIGSIEVGKRADLVLVDLNSPDNFSPVNSVSAKEKPDAVVSSLVYATLPHHVRSTWVDGRLLYSNGKVHTLPRAGLMRRARDAQDVILNSVKKGSGR